MFDSPPDIPPNTPPIHIAQASQGELSRNGDPIVIGFCQRVTSDQPLNNKADNVVFPIDISRVQLNREGRRVGLAGTVKILSGPEHGVLRERHGKDVKSMSYTYLPVTGYDGPDDARFHVEIEGYSVEVNYHLIVMPRSPAEGLDFSKCPGGSQWTISPKAVSETDTKVLHEMRTTNKSTLSGPRITFIEPKCGCSIFIEDTLQGICVNGKINVDGGEIWLEPILGGPPDEGRDALLDYKFLKHGPNYVLVEYIDKRVSGQDTSSTKENVVIKIRSGLGTTVIRAIEFCGC